MTVFSKTMGVCLMLSVMGCTTHEIKPIVQQPLPYSVYLANATEPVPSIDDIFSLTAQQQATFLNFFNHPSLHDTPPHARVYQYLSKLVAGFDYQGENYTAREAFELKKGNCITLAVLTMALANLVGVDITFQQITSAPVVSIENDLFVSSDHVRTFLHAPPVPTTRNIISLRSYIVVDYFPTAGDMNGERLSESTFIAMYYRNLATDAFLEGKNDKAFALLRAALKHSPDFAPTINLTALLHKEMGQFEMAARWYQYGLNVSSRRTTLLSNYAMLKQAEGDDAAAESLLLELGSSKELSPFLWYMQGRTALKQQNYQQAVKYFKRLTDSAPYVGDFYLQLAKAYFYDQRYADARSALAQAAKIASNTNDRIKYNAKLEALKLHAYVD